MQVFKNKKPGSGKSASRKQSSSTDGSGGDCIYHEKVTQIAENGGNSAANGNK
jgi:hypothetical protein